MKTLKTPFRNINIDVNKIAEGVKNMHHEDEDKKIVLAFGMLDAVIMDLTEKNLKQKFFSFFNELELIICEEDINKFISECMHEISLYVYKNSNLIV